MSQSTVTLTTSSGRTYMRVFRIQTNHLIKQLNFITSTRTNDPKTVLRQILRDRCRAISSIRVPSIVLTRRSLPRTRVLTSCLARQQKHGIAVRIPRHRVGTSLVSVIRHGTRCRLTHARTITSHALRSLRSLTIILSLPSLPGHVRNCSVSRVRNSSTITSRIIFISNLPTGRRCHRCGVGGPRIHPNRSSSFTDVTRIVHHHFHHCTTGPSLPHLNGPS